MALYHKHRPQNFSSVIGQDPIVKTLSNQVLSNKIAHAYLFSGPRGVGKTTLARILSKAINCPNRTEKDCEPCNNCETCEEINKSRSIDVIEIDAASHTGVDNVRENIIENAQFRPTKSKSKIFIIDEVHMLSTSAFNALLKTLEEPPEHVIFILATTEFNKLPDTIVSRCQRFDFKKVDYEEMKKQLKHIAEEEDIKIEDEVLDRIINKSDGCVRDAISLFDQLTATGEKKITEKTAKLILPSTGTETVISFLELIAERNLKNGLEAINSLSENGLNFNQFFDECLEALRLIMIQKANASVSASGLNFDGNLKIALKNIAQKMDFPDIIKLVDLFLKRKPQIKTSPLPQMPLEMILIEWSSIRDSAGLSTPPAEIQTASKKNNSTEDSTAKTTPTLNFEEVSNKWSAFIDKIEKEYPSLSFILKMSNLLKMTGNELTLVVKYSFHKDKLSEKVVMKKLEDILSKIMDYDLKLKIMLGSDDISSSQNQELQDLAASFGGEIV